MVTLTANKLLGCFMVGILFILIGGVVDVIFNEYLPRKILKEVTISPGSSIYDDWIQDPVPTYYQVWLFDIQNANEIVNNGAKPDLIERGPYTYREYRRKYNISFNENNTVSYKENQYYVFDRDASVGPESDTITSANVLMMTIANIIKNEFNYITELTEFVLDLADDNNLFTKHTVSEVLWGYNDTLLSRVNNILKPHNKSIDNQIGLFHGKNNTYDGIYTVHKEREKLGEITRWNGMTESPHWTTEKCRMINGTEGRFFHPDVKPIDTLYVFSSDCYRSFYLEYLEEKVIKDIKLYSFVIPDHLFALTEENAGFCTPFGHCTPYGLMNITLYKEDAPIILSQPHFYAADPEVVNGVIGLHPTPIQHQTILDVEPMTGVVMNVNKRLQINIYLENVTNIKETMHLENGLYLPMVWINESASINDDAARKFKNQIILPIHIVTGMEFALIILGALMSGGVMLFSLKNCICSSLKGHFRGEHHSEEDDHSHLIKPQQQIRSYKSDI